VCTLTITYHHPADVQMLRQAADLLGYTSLEEFVQVAAYRFSQQTISIDERFKEWMGDNQFKLNS